MNRALIGKTWRDHRFLFGLVFLTAVIFPVLLIVALSSTPADMVSKWIQLPLIRNFLRMLTGTDPVVMLSRTGFAAFAFVHPFILAVTWAFFVVICTGVLAGEIDRGSADLLLSLPVSRWGMYASVSAAILAAIPFLAIAPWLGACSSEFAKEWSEPLDRSRLLLAAVNGMAAYAAVAGVGLAISAALSRRGLAVAVMFAALLLSFLLNVLGTIWAPAERVAFLGLMHYFRPLVIIQNGRLSATDLAVLGAIALAGWITGGIIFSRRDIRTT